MFGRRSKKAESAGSEAEVGSEATETEAETVGETPSATSRFDRSDGPWDSSEREVPEDDPTWVDVGAMVLHGRVGLDLQIPTDPETGAASAVVMRGDESAVELRAFAAPRSGGLWSQVRPEIVAEVGRVGGKVEERDGSFGAELRVEVPVKLADGKQGVQTTRIIGIDGPRWLLRGTFMGRLATEPDDDSVLEQAVREVVVVRGGDPMPPREQIPVVVPAGAVRMEQKA
ncbi:uncharacterized protein DUF3710 [Mumia flava]|uniref:Uncharacterized protein DUF3710 n=2 Tax=Mumia flava TaxID=1348852 RepID=A0A0B2BPG5_9ACTN|nr:uncharacterized protein DUF3710 [Mumia flava]